jgi:trigger factor
LTEGQEQPKTPEQVEQEFPSFEHQLRWQLVSDQVFIDNNIRVSEADVKEEIKGKVLSYFGMENTEDAPWMDSYMEKVAKDEKTMNETYRQLMFARLFDFLRTKFILEEQEIGEEEFFKLPSAHAMHHHH